MEIIIDGQPGFLPTTQPVSLSSVLSDISDHLEAQRRGMLGIVVDGASIAADDLEGALAGRSIESVLSVEVRSEALAELAAARMQAVKDVLPELENACRQLAEVFSSGAEDEAYGQFDELAGAWVALKEQQRQIARALGANLDEIVENDDVLRAHHEKLSRFLTEAGQAITSRDQVLMADLLEYEFAPLAERERTVLETLDLLLKERSAGA